VADTEAKVLCESPTSGKQGTRIAKWKYDAVRKAIRDVVSRSSTGTEFRQLAGLVEQALSADHRRRLGSVAWYTVTVKLHLECIGEIERIAGSKPQRIRRR
jgi:hypothetical protein